MTANGQLQLCWSSRWHWQVCFQVIWGHLLLCPLHIRTLRHAYTHGPHTLRAWGRRPSRGSVKVSCEPAEWVSKERGSSCVASQVCIVYCLKGLICLTEWVSSLSAGSHLCCGPLGPARRYQLQNAMWKFKFLCQAEESHSWIFEFFALLFLTWGRMYGWPF